MFTNMEIIVVGELHCLNIFGNKSWKNSDFDRIPTCTACASQILVGLHFHLGCVF